MKLVLDTNVLVAAFLTRGVCHDLLAHTLANHVVVVSDPILTEVERVLRIKARLSDDLVEEALRLLRSETTFGPARALDHAICRDPDDDLIIATALSNDCAVIISGDADLLSLRQVEGVRMIAPGEFWAFEDGRTVADR